MQLTDDYKWINFLFLQEIGNRWNFCGMYFTRRIYHNFSYISGSVGYSRLTCTVIKRQNPLHGFPYFLLQQSLQSHPNSHKFLLMKSPNRVFSQFNSFWIVKGGFPGCANLCLRLCLSLFWW